MYQPGFALKHEDVVTVINDSNKLKLPTRNAQYEHSLSLLPVSYQSWGTHTKTNDPSIIFAYIHRVLEHFRWITISPIPVVICSTEGLSRTRTK